MRLPYAPVVRAAGSETQLARCLGWDDVTEMHQNTNLAHASKRGLTWPVADELACALNLHPSEVWGDLWWASSEWPSPQGKKAHPRARRPRWGLVRAEMESA